MFEYDKNSKIERTERISHNDFSITKYFNFYNERYEDKRRVVKRKKI